MSINKSGSKKLSAVVKVSSEEPFAVNEQPAQKHQTEDNVGRDAPAEVTNTPANDATTSQPDEIRLDEATQLDDATGQADAPAVPRNGPAESEASVVPENTPAEGPTSQPDQVPPVKEVHQGSTDATETKIETATALAIIKLAEAENAVFFPDQHGDAFAWIPAAQPSRHFECHRLGTRAFRARLLALAKLKAKIQPMPSDLKWRNRNTRAQLPQHPTDRSGE